MKKASQKTLFALVFVAVFALTSAACLYGIAGDSIKKTFQVRSGGQLKFNLSLRGDTYQMTIPDVGAVDINDFRDNYDALRA